MMHDLPLGSQQRVQEKLPCTFQPLTSGLPHYKHETLTNTHKPVALHVHMGASN